MVIAWIATRPPAEARDLWGARSLALARRGDIVAAAAATEALHRLAPDDVESLLLVARAYALCVEAGARLAAWSGRGESRAASPEAGTQ